MREKINVRIEETFLDDTLMHDCEIVGDCEISDEWRFCPHCGRGLVRAITNAFEEQESKQWLAELEAFGGPQLED